MTRSKKIVAYLNTFVTHMCDMQGSIRICLVPVLGFVTPANTFVAHSNTFVTHTCVMQCDYFKHVRDGLM